MIFWSLLIQNNKKPDWSRQQLGFWDRSFGSIFKRYWFIERSEGSYWYYKLWIKLGNRKFYINSFIHIITFSKPFTRSLFLSFCYSSLSQMLCRCTRCRFTDNFSQIFVYCWKRPLYSLPRTIKLNVIKTKPTMLSGIHMNKAALTPAFFTRFWRYITRSTKHSYSTKISLKAWKYVHGFYNEVTKLGYD